MTSEDTFKFAVFFFMASVELRFWLFAREIRKLEEAKQ